MRCQAKQLCLAIVRTIILERKPVPVVARAMDVLLTAYSQAIKSGSYYKRIAAEETSPSNASGVNRPTAVVGESVSGIDASRSINQEHESVTGNESDGPSITTERGDLLEPGVLGGEDLPTGHSQILGPANNQLNPNASQRNQSQVTSSAATSPADFYSYVLAPIEEEMTGDGSYLTAIIVEFLRRYSWKKFVFTEHVSSLSYCRIRICITSLNYDKLILLGSNSYRSNRKPLMNC